MGRSTPTIRTVRLQTICIASAIAASSLARAQTPITARAPRPVLGAVRIATPPRIDGAIDDDVWTLAPIGTNFVQRYPDPNLPATHQTEVRVLYDDNAIYVGARMFDPHPDSIAAPLGRRDPGDISSDWIDVMFDSYHDSRTGFRFATNPAGTKLDVYHFNDGDDDDSWDAFWDVKTRIDSLGWTAEFRIPLSQLRFHGAVGEQTWGLNFYRAVARRDEWTFWSPYPPTTPGFVSAFGELRGLVGLEPPSPVEIQPYVSSRVRTGGDVASSPFHGAAHPGASAGVDLRVGLGSALSLTATVNPDFGQVEVDPAVINLTSIETFFPEKRPFFLEGSGIFDFGSMPYFASYGTQRLVHWRRIGRSPQLSPNTTWSESPEPTSILGAAKLSGQFGGGWSVGVLDAVTNRENVRTVDAAGLTSRATIEPLSNYFVGRVKRDFSGGRTTIGLLASSTNRSLDDTFTNALRSNAYVLGVDGTRSSANRRWMLGGSVVGSRVDGSDRALAATQRSSVRFFGRPGATYLPFDPSRATLSGHMATVGIVYRGTPVFASLEAKEVSPGFESNDLGYLPRADFRSLTAAIGTMRNSSKGTFRELRATTYMLDAWNFAGQEIWRDFGVNGSATFSNLWRVGARADYYPSVFDDRLTRGGPLVRQPSRVRASMSLESDSRRAVRGSVTVLGERRPLAGFDRSVSASLIVRPTPSIQLSARPSFDVMRDASQYVRTVADAAATTTYNNRYVFATLDQRTFSTDLRADWTFTPALSFQLYAQPFKSRARFSDYKELTAGTALSYGVYGRAFGTTRTLSDGRLEIDPDALGPASAFTIGGSPDQSSFRSHARRLNAVLRKEYRNGSVMYLVWQHTADGARPIDSTLAPWTIVPATNVLLLKFAYRFGR